LFLIQTFSERSYCSPVWLAWSSLWESLYQKPKALYSILIWPLFLWFGFWNCFDDVVFFVFSFPLIILWLIWSGFLKIILTTIGSCARDGFLLNIFRRIVENFSKLSITDCCIVKAICWSETTIYVVKSKWHKKGGKINPIFFLQKTNLVSFC